MDTGLEIRTDRLVLSPPALGDIDDFAALLGDAAIMRFIGGPLTREAAWQRLQARAGSWLMLGFGMWMVREAGDGEAEDGGAGDGGAGDGGAGDGGAGSTRIVGEVGFLDGKREGVAGIDGDPEIGWALAPGAQGRGLGREMVMAALGWGGQRFAGQFLRTVAMIDPAHERSIALAEGLGFERFAEAVYLGHPRGLWQRRFGAGL
jgi:RimJ/RimL family protein N-acetyltransferase